MEKVLKPGLKPLKYPVNWIFFCFSTFMWKAFQVCELWTKHRTLFNFAWWRSTALPNSRGWGQLFREISKKKSTETAMIIKPYLARLIALEKSEGNWMSMNIIYFGLYLDGPEVVVSDLPSSTFRPILPLVKHTQSLPWKTYELFGFTRSSLFTVRMWL